MITLADRYPPGMNILAVKRISRDTETSSALERQDLALRETVATLGANLVHMVEDATVSGAVNLDERPSLGKWVKQPLMDRWHGLLVTTQDRITRDDMHWWAFVHWILKNNKDIIIVDDPSFDIRTEDGRMVAGIKASMAAKYRRTIQEKRLGQTEYFRDENLWPGGTWPFGYRQERIIHNDRPRWRLVIDPITAPLVLEAYDRVINDLHSVGSIANDWNRRGILTSQDHQRFINYEMGWLDKATKIKGSRWDTGKLMSILNNPAIVGYAMHKNEIRRKDGLPVQWASPILTPAQFETLGIRLKERGAFRVGISNPTNPLNGVLWCKCGEIIHATSTTRTYGRYFYYGCSTIRSEERCAHAFNWKREFICDFLEESFLSEVGDTEVMRKSFTAGKDYSSDIKSIEEAMENLASAIAGARSPKTIATLTATMERYEENLEELKAQPVVEAQWSTEATGETYRELWARLEWQSRGDLLRKSGVRLYMAGTPGVPDLHLYVPEDLAATVEDILSGAFDIGEVESWLSTVTDHQKGSESLTEPRTP